MTIEEQKKTKYVLAEDNGHFILVTDVPIGVTEDEIMEIAYEDRRAAETLWYESLHRFGKSDEAEEFWCEVAIPLPMPGCYIENPIIIPNKEDFDKNASYNSNAIWLGGVHSVFSYENKWELISNKDSNGGDSYGN